MWWVCSVFTLPLQKFIKIIYNKFGSPRGGSYIDDIKINKGYDEKFRH